MKGRIKGLLTSSWTCAHSPAPGACWCPDPDLERDPPPQDTIADSSGARLNVVWSAYTLLSHIIIKFDQTVIQNDYFRFWIQLSMGWQFWFPISIQFSTNYRMYISKDSSIKFVLLLHLLLLWRQSSNLVDTGSKERIVISYVEDWVTFL